MVVHFAVLLILKEESLNEWKFHDSPARLEGRTQGIRGLTAASRVRSSERMVRHLVFLGPFRGEPRAFRNGLEVSLRQQASNRSDGHVRKLLVFDCGILDLFWFGETDDGQMERRGRCGRVVFQGRRTPDGGRGLGGRGLGGLTAAFGPRWRRWLRLGDCQRRLVGRSGHGALREWREV